MRRFMYLGTRVRDVTPDVCQAMVLSEPRQFTQSSYPRPEIGARDALLSVEMTSICGGDIKLYSGSVDAAAYPLVPGHEVVGRVAAMGDRFGGNASKGDRVVVEPYIPCYDCHFCFAGQYSHCEEGRCYGVTLSSETPPHLWGGYGEYVYLAPNAKLHPIPESVPAKAACLASVVGNGLNWSSVKGNVSPTDSVTVIGPGVQGLASVLVAALAGADPIILVGRSADERRLALGRRLGATRTVTVDEDTNTATAVPKLQTQAADIVIVTAPATAAIELSTDLVAPLGTIVLPAVTGGKRASLPTDELVYREIDIRTGIGQPNLMGDAIEILAGHGEDVAKMISHTYPVSEAEHAIRQQIPGEPVYNADIVHAALSLS